MKVLVTGGAGYVGSALTPLLLGSGNTVRVFDSLLHGGRSLLGVWANPNFEFRKGDVRDTAALRDAVQGMDAVVHLAAIVGDPACARNPEDARAINRDASLALIDICRKAGVKRFVFASTCSNYGKMADASRLVDETSELRPVSLYAETKVAVERAALDAPANDPLSVTLLRFATVFGVSPRMRFDLTVNEFTLEMLCKEKLVVFGEQFWRPYVHVQDAARAIQMALQAPIDDVRRQVFNVGSTDQNYQKQQLVDLIRPYAPRAVVEYVHKQEDPRDYKVSFAKIQSALKYNTTRNVTDGIREVAALVMGGVVANTDAPEYRN